GFAGKVGGRKTHVIFLAECELPHTCGRSGPLPSSGPKSCFGESVAMAHHRISTGLAAAALLALPMQPGALADTGAKIVEEVDFATSCSSAVQHTFKHAVWTLHSFWYPEALKDFRGVTGGSPNWAIGYGGTARAHGSPLWPPPSPAALKAGSEAVERATAAPTKTEREKDYIAAIAAFYRDNDKLD